MGSIDWNSEEIPLSEILSAMLSGVEEYNLRYTDVIDANPLERTLADMVNRVSMTKPNLINLITLERLGIVGNRLVKLWHLCEDNQVYFEKTVGYMTGTALSKCFTEDEVTNNMHLESPVSFIPNDEIVPYFPELFSKFQDNYDEMLYVLRSDFVKRYNEQASISDVVIPLLPMPEKPEEEEYSLDKKTRVNPARLYFGLVTRDLSGGVLGINMQVYGLFECGPNVMKVADKLFYTLRDLEDGTYIVVDDEGKKVDWDQPVDFEGESLLPTKQVVTLSVGPLKNIIKDAIEHGMENPVIKKYKDMLINGASVLECDEMLSDLSHLYQDLYGSLDNKKEL